MDKLKKVKGSAIYLDDGGVIFTPYQNKPENSPWKKVVAVAGGKMKATEEVLQVVISVPRDKRAYSKAMSVFSELMLKIGDML